MTSTHSGGGVHKGSLLTDPGLGKLVTFLLSCRINKTTDWTFEG